MKTNDNREMIAVMVQGLYGNRTDTRIVKEDFDAFMLGHLDGNLRAEEEIDRTVVRVPGTDNLVIAYNKHQEERALVGLRDFIQNLKETQCRYNPTAVIPELGIVLFSRCIICRMNSAGEPSSIEAEDYEKVLPYLAQ